MITGLLLKADMASDADIAQSLKELRPHAPMLVISTGDDYVSAMLTALRA
jgi:ethanolamine utilization protein EutP (predicted NTPase)